MKTRKLILMDTQELTVPACMRTAKSELLDYMGTVILAFQAYRGGETNKTVVDLIRKSDTHYGNFREELKSIEECAPFCFP